MLREIRKWEFENEKQGNPRADRLGRQSNNGKKKPKSKPVPLEIVDAAPTEKTNSQTQADAGATQHKKKAPSAEGGRYNGEKNQRENLVGGGGGFGFGDWRGSGFPRFGDGTCLALWQLDAEGGAASFFAGDRDGAMVIADDGLNDGEAEAGALQLGGVVRREDARALFRREPLAGIRDFDADSIATVGGAEAESAAGGHGVQGIQNEILEGAMQQIGIGIDFRQRFAEEIFGGDGRLADGIELRLEQANSVAQSFVDIDMHELRSGHLGKIAEAADDAVEVGEFGFERGGGFAKNFLELLGTKLAGTLKIFDGELQGEKRIAQFVSEATGQFTPGSDAFGLHELFFLRGEGARHVVEGAGKLADFVVALNIDVRVPVTG